ncbi:MAG TPA: Asp23/Gls24 family envelope stress response protein [Chloroflexi bacterium]|nr:Asp23/Gls24 family envelope stress response protein [Chloroflexota bacterium]
MEEAEGRVTIAPEILVTIARLTTLSVPGVARMAGGHPAGLGRRLRRNVATGEGVLITYENHHVCVDLYIVVEADVNMRRVGKQIQNAVTRAIHDMVGLEVKRVDVHIQDVAYPTTPQTHPSSTD